MTEWDAAEYERVSGLQLAMAEEVLAVLDLNGARRILDIGCGNGKITAEIAARVPHATVLGVDPSHEMIEFASGHYDRAWLRDSRQKDPAPGASDTNEVR
jgi:trans-aconitate 2-methyltransferase